MAEPKRFEGPVVFVSGVHYPVDEDGEGADLSRPLRVAEDGSWRDAEEGEPLHNDMHHAQHLELDPGGED
jgi:hypothetical protein